MSNDETRVSFDKTIPLRDNKGELVGEALITMRHGEIIISAEIKPNSSLGRELMHQEGAMILRFGDGE